MALLTDQLKMLQKFGRTSILRDFQAFVKQNSISIKTSPKDFVCNKFISTNSNGDENLSDKNSSTNEIKENSEGSCKPGKAKDTKLRVKRHTSPSVRLQSILPDTFTESLTNTSPRSDEKTVDRPQTEGEKQAESKNSKDFMNMRFRSSVLPSRRLSKLIPEDYWDKVNDTETKQIVDELGTQIESSNKKKE